VAISAHDSKYLQDLSPEAYIPFVYLRYLGVRRQFQRQKVGTMLLMNFLQRCSQVVVDIGGVYGAAVHALTDQAASLYDNLGFREYRPGGSTRPFMILPVRALADLARVQPPA
jgi:GNAT superfamily N-acetyltransferase